MIGNPFNNHRLYPDPESAISKRAAAIRKSQPQKALLLDRIAQQPQAIWLTGYESFRELSRKLADIEEKHELGVFVLYFIPDRDMNGYSRGGAMDEDEYQDWTGEVSRFMKGRRTVVILEPDALAHIKDTASYEAQRRLYLLQDTVAKLKMNRDCAVYIDAGHPRWHHPDEIAGRLNAAGIGMADGFSLNVSNFILTQENVAYGKKISRRVRGKHFVIDTSRNGNGPRLRPDGRVEWCNPPGMALGTAPTTTTGNPLADAYLWIKRPGQSDGECNGGPPAGVFWEEYALELAGSGVSLH